MCSAINIYSIVTSIVRGYSDCMFPLGIKLWYHLMGSVMNNLDSTLFANYTNYLSLQQPPLFHSNFMSASSEQ